MPETTRKLTQAQMQALLEPGETLIWQGWPDSFDTSRPQEGMFWLMFGGIFAFVGLGFTLVGLAVFSQEHMFTLIFPILGILLLCSGIGFILGPRILRRRKLEGTLYLLTDRRAIIINSEVTSFPITPEMKLDYQPASGKRAGSVFFGSKVASYTINDQEVVLPVGFAQISEAPEVVQAIRAVQDKMQSAAAEASHG